MPCGGGTVDPNCGCVDPGCNTNICLGDTETFDPVNCVCVLDETQVLGCTDPLADNYAPAANCDDNSCTYTNCILTYEGQNITQGNVGGVSPFYYDAYEVNILDGTPPYDYNWSTQGFVRPGVVGVGNIKVICSDNASWAVTVTDNLGCQVIISEDLINGVGNNGVPPTLDIESYDVDPSACGESTGSIDISIFGGTGSYTYLWNTGATSEDIGGLYYGWYSVTVTDSAGEMTMGWYWVPCAVPGRAKTTGFGLDAITSAPNPFSTETTIEFTAGESGNALVEVYDLAGAKVTTLFDGAVEQDQVYKTLFNAGQLASGVYFTRFVPPTGKVSYTKLLLAK